MNRLKGDLNECDNLQQIKYTTIVRDRNSLEATNRELASLVKNLKRKLEDEAEKYHHLDTEYKLLQMTSKKANADLEKQALTLKEYEAQIRDLKDQLGQEKDLLTEKKQKWKGRIAALQGEIDKLKEQNYNLDNRISHYEQVVVSQDNTITDEKDKLSSVENRLEQLKAQLDEANREALANQEKLAAQDSELTELNIRMQYENKAAADLKAALDAAKSDIADRDIKLEELRRESKAKRKASSNQGC